MRTSELHYDLPPERIAQRPAEPRDASRLLVLHREGGRIEHRTFREIEQLLRPGDCLVLNDTRVIPARFFLRRATGGRIEALFLHAETHSVARSPDFPADWRIMLRGGGRLRPGERLRCELADDAELELIARGERGEWTVRPNPPCKPEALLQRIGQTPLPPYIRREEGGRPAQPETADTERYQTVYARAAGAVAAPTAGLHFTPALLERVEASGVRLAYVTLHVGPGTFAPIEATELSQHRMHAEWYTAPAATAQAIRAARAAGGRVLAAGTTSARVLETLGNLAGTDAGPAGAFSGWTDIFIYPPYRFRNVDALLTNFHLPGSTLLALVMALAGPDLIRRAYAEAISQEYRFYSYGDAMLIL